MTVARHALDAFLFALRGDGAKAKVEATRMHPLDRQRLVTACDQLTAICAEIDAAPRPLRVNGGPIPQNIANGPPGDFARYCGETDPAVLALLDTEAEDVD